MKQSLSFIFKALPLTIYGLFLLFASSAEAQAADIRVSGFNSSRNPAPLTGFTPNVYFEEDYAASLRNTLLDESNFGPGGTISCSVNFQPFVSSVVRGSLVSGGQKRSEVFFAGISNRELAGDEASELADFIRAGGIVYVSAEAYSAYQGLGIPGFEGTKFNPLFSSLGISDSFPQGEVIDFHPCGTTSTPIGTPVTTGPFGIIDPIGHSIFNPINTSTLQSIATGFNELCFIGFSLEEEGVISPLAAESGQYDRTILAEGQLGQGYLAVSGEALYTYSEYDENIRNYFLNLFALACPGGADQPPVPFLDLPWDYQGKGLSFSEAATAIGSYFDHEYPFSDVGSVLGEPLEAKGSVLSFQGPPRDLTLNYSNHDGYDWLGPARVHNDDPVLAAASGTATFYKADKNNTACGTWACGNVIVVDHGNGYQTRYYHLQDNDPISQSFTTPRFVNGGEVIGKVGSTGKSTAPHIHFSVIQDKDQDGDFNDDRPDGLTDPFGWQSEEEDPWPNYSFTYKGVERTGNKSHYLWTNPIANLSSELTSNGGYFRLERYELNFPQDATADPLTVEVQYSPSVTISDSFESLGSGLYLNVIDATGNPITTFPQEFTLTIDFSDFDISKYKISSISIYSSGNGVDWAKEETDVDFANSVATATLNHASYFVLGGEKADAAPPETQILLSGEEGESGWFRSDVSITLFAQDGDEGSGVYYTGYKVDDGYFQEYKETFVVSDEGEHTIEFYSVDNSGNVEEVKLFTFHIDKTPPEARFRFDPEKLDTEVLGIDENEVEVIFVKSAYRLRPDLITLRDKAGNTLKLEGEFRRADTNDIFSFKSIRYNEGASIFFGRNFYSTAFKLDRYSKKLSYLLQNWYDKSKTLLAIIYNAKGDKSEIYTLDGSGNIQKETKQGLMLLFIKTNNSNLEFGYE